MRDIHFDSQMNHSKDLENLLEAHNEMGMEMVLKK